MACYDSDVHTPYAIRIERKCEWGVRKKGAKREGVIVEITCALDLLVVFDVLGKILAGHVKRIAVLFEHGVIELESAVRILRTEVRHVHRLHGTVL